MVKFIYFLIFNFGIVDFFSSGSIFTLFRVCFCPSLEFRIFPLQMILIINLCASFFFFLWSIPVIHFNNYIIILLLF